MSTTLPKRPSLPTIPEILDKVSDLTDNITARLPEVKIPSANFGRIPGVDAVKRIPSLFSIDLTNLDVRKIADTPVANVAKRAADEVREVAYTAVGFGVLAVQKVQVRRREFFEARRSPEAEATVAAPVTTPANAPVAAPKVAAPAGGTASQAPVQDTVRDMTGNTAGNAAGDIATGNTEPELA